MSIKLLPELTSPGFHFCSLLLIFSIQLLLHMLALGIDPQMGICLYKMDPILLITSVPSFYQPGSHFRLKIRRFEEFRPNVSNFQEDSIHFLCILSANKLGSHLLPKESSSKNSLTVCILWEVRGIQRFWWGFLRDVSWLII